MQIQRLVQAVRAHHVREFIRAIIDTRPDSEITSGPTSGEGLRIWLYEFRLVVFVYNQLSSRRQRDFRQWWKECVVVDKEGTSFLEWQKMIAAKDCPASYLVNLYAIGSLEILYKLHDLLELDEHDE